MSGNINLNVAGKAKQDEFYTQLTDITNELAHYTKHFKGKTILCNCDDPRVSNFFKYFSFKFEELGLKKLIATCYKNQEMDLFSQNNSEKAIWLEYSGEKDGGKIPTAEQIGIHQFSGDGDFRSQECIELLKQADIVCTNPPFSLFREYMEQLIKYDKKFLIIGSQNNITYKEIFPLIKENKIWLGYHTGHTLFAVPDYYTIPDFYDKNDKKTLSSNGYKIDENGKLWRNLGNICWYTNLDIKKRHDDLDLFKFYSPAEYPKYDNYDAIEVSKVVDIPKDYDGAMGVPITIMDKYNPEQFEILGITDRQNTSGLRTKKYTEDDSPKFNDLNARSVLKLPNGEYKQMYARILIRNKKVQK